MGWLCFALEFCKVGQWFLELGYLGIGEHTWIGFLFRLLLIFFLWESIDIGLFLCSGMQSVPLECEFAVGYFICDPWTVSPLDWWVLLKDCMVLLAFGRKWNASLQVEIKPVMLKHLFVSNSIDYPDVEFPNPNIWPDIESPSYLVFNTELWCAHFVYLAYPLNRFNPSL